MSKSRTPRIRQLEALMAVIHNGSVTAAAADLGISQPATSRLLSDLSKEFDFQLLDKRDGRLIPTQETRLLQPDIQRVLELMSQISEVSKDITNRQAGHLRVACLPGFATSHLPGVVSKFLEKRPGVRMTIEPDRPERILEWMIGEQYDFGITDGFTGHPAVESINVDIRTVCVFPNGDDLGSLEIVTPQDLEGKDFIQPHRDSDFYHRISKAFSDAHVPIQSRVEVRQFTAACELVCNGAGVAIVSELDAIKYSENGLSYRPFHPTSPHSLSLVRPILKKPSLLTLEFIEYFEDSLSPYLLTKD